MLWDIAIWAASRPKSLELTHLQRMALLLCAPLSLQTVDLEEIILSTPYRSYRLDCGG